MILSPSNKWKPTPAIHLSMLVFVCGLAVILWRPGLWIWAAGLVFINHLILALAGLVPRSTMLGPNITRLPRDAAQRGEMAITIDDGPDPEVTPLVLDILDRYQAKATFFCIGKLAARHPDLCRDIIRRGHAIENHSLSHQWFFSLLAPGSIYREVDGAQRLLGEISGQTPRFFRPTAGLRSPGLEPVLARCGLRLCSWSRRGFDTRLGNADVVLAKLARGLTAGDILLLHDGNAARTAEGRPVILDVLPRLLDVLEQSNLRSVTLCSALS